MAQKHTLPQRAASQASASTSPRVKRERSSETTGEVGFMGEVLTADDALPNHLDSKRRLNDSFTSLNYRGQPLAVYESSQKFDYTEHEHLPQLPTTHPPFYRAVSLIDEIIGLVDNATKSTAGKDTSSNISNVLEGLRECAAIKYPKTTVGVIGNSGTGKSTFLSVLLGRPSLAKADGSEESCTQVATEYVDDPALGDDHFIGEVFFKNEQSRKAEIELHFNSFVNYVETNNRLRHGLSPNEDLQRELEEMEDVFIVAKDFLLQLFANRDDFQRNTLDRLAELKIDERAELIAELQQSVEGQLRQHLNSGKASHVISRQGLSALQEAIKPFSESSQSGQPAWWPLVTLIQIRLDAPLLRQGIIIADCPGVSDSNASRRQIAHNYLATCSVVLVMADIARILTDDSVKGFLGKYIVQHGFARTVLVATMIDDKLGSNPEGISKEEADQLVSLKARFDEANDAFLKERTMQNLDNKEETEAAWCRMRILLRNSTVQSQAMDSICIPPGLYRKPHEFVAFLPCSSKTEEEYILGHGARKSQSLAISETGFAAIRAKLTAFGHEGRIEILQGKAEDLVTQLRHLDFLLDTCITPHDETNIIVGKIPLPRAQVLEKAPTVIESLQQCLKDTVSTNIAAQLNRPDSEWTNKFHTKLEAMLNKSPHALSIKAFCRKDGVHKPRKASQLVDWNRELAELLIPDLQGFLARFAKESRIIACTIIDDVAAIHMQVKDNLQQDEHIYNTYLVGTPDPMDEYRRNWSRRMRIAFEALRTKLRVAMISDISNTFGTTSTDDGDDQHLALGIPVEDTAFYRAMNQVYQGCLAAVPPKTKHAGSKLRDYLLGAVASNAKGSPMYRLVQSVEQALTKVLAGFEPKLTRLLRQPFDAVEKDLVMLLKQSSGLREEQRAQMQANLASARARIEEKRAELFDALEFVSHMESAVDVEVDA